MIPNCRHDSECRSPKYAPLGYSGRLGYQGIYTSQMKCLPASTRHENSARGLIGVLARNDKERRIAERHERTTMKNPDSVAHLRVDEHDHSAFAWVVIERPDVLLIPDQQLQELNSPLSWPQEQSSTRMQYISS